MSTQAELISLARANVIKIDPKARMFSDTDLSAFLNEAQEVLQTDMYDDIPEQQDKATWNISTGTQEYLMSVVLPWYKKINKIDMDQCNIDDISDTVWEPSRYCIYGTTIYTNTIPSASKTVKIYYSKYLPQITSTVDCVLPREYNFAMVCYASYLALLSVEKTEKARNCYQEYEQAKAKLITINNRRQLYNFINY